jgi:hypothetical protein
VTKLITKKGGKKKTICDNRRELYKHGVCSPLLKCLSRTEGMELMKEIHAGLCGSHIGSRPLLGKVFRQGFYWPKAASDAAELVQNAKAIKNVQEIRSNLHLSLN